MNWVVWYHATSGSRSSKAHSVEGFYANRTACGKSITFTLSPAHNSVERCRFCIRALKRTAMERSHKRDEALGRCCDRGTA